MITLGIFVIFALFFCGVMHTWPDIPMTMMSCGLAVLATLTIYCIIDASWPAEAVKNNTCYLRPFEDGSYLIYDVPHDEISIKVDEEEDPRTFDLEKATEIEYHFSDSDPRLEEYGSEIDWLFFRGSYKKYKIFIPRNSQRLILKRGQT